MAWHSGLWLAAFLAFAAVLTAPLAASVLLIALFGLPHILCELRYCDERFSARIPRAALWAIGALLVALVLMRIVQAAGLVPAAIAVPAELTLGLLLSGTALFFMHRHRIAGALFALTFALGIVFAPIATFLIAAWLHNLTPLGFVAEILPAAERRRALITLAIPFLLVPVLLASGLPQNLIGYEATRAPSLFGAERGPLSSFIAPGRAFADALPLFSAAVFAQMMHYFAVIVLMPRLLSLHGRQAPAILAWPSWPRFYAGIAVLALIGVAFYAAAYGEARAWYGVAAAVHSWLELPLFLLALGTGFTAARTDLLQTNTTPHSPPVKA